MTTRDEALLDDLALLVEGDPQAQERWADALADDAEARDTVHDAVEISRMVEGAGADFVLPDDLLSRVQAELALGGAAPDTTLVSGGAVPAASPAPESAASLEPDLVASSSLGSSAESESSAPVSEWAPQPSGAKPASAPSEVAASSDGVPAPIADLSVARETKRSRAGLVMTFGFLAAAAAAAAAAAFVFLPGHGPGDDKGESLATGEGLGGSVALLAGGSADGLTVVTNEGEAPSVAGRDAAIAPGAIVATDARTRAELRLDEGTSVTLNQGSRLQLDKDRREVHLEAGEALFDVAHLEDQGFAVVVPGGRVEVLGTKFLVTVLPDGGSAVQVIRGKVRLETESGSVELVRGQEGQMRSGERPRALPAPGLGEGLGWSELDVGLEDDAPVPGIGELRAHRPGEREERERDLVLAQHDVRVRVSGAVARTEIEETFRNDEDETLEGVYRFPLPPGARIAKLSLEVDGEWIDGAVVPKDRGRAIWRGVIRNAEGPRRRPQPQEEWIWVPGPWRDPALLEWQRGGRVELRIFPIPAHGVRRVRVAYEQHVQPHGDSRRYVYPLPQAGDGSTNIGSFSMDMRVAGAREVSSRGLDLVAGADGDVATLRGHRESFAPSGDIVVDYTERDAERELRWFAYGGQVAAAPEAPARGDQGERSVRARELQQELARDDRGHVVFALRPELPTQGTVQPSDVVVVLDSSQSMVGERYTRAGRLARRIAGELDRRDRVMLVACDVECRVLPGGLRTPSIETADAFEQFLQAHEPAGASNLVAGLRDAVRLARLAGADRELRLLYVGDGAASVGYRSPAGLRAEIEGLVSEVRAGGGHLAVSTVGIGQDADDASLQAIARAGGGTHLGFTPGQRMNETAYAVLAALYGTTLENASVELPHGLTLPAPTALPNLRAGEELLLAARYTGQSVRGDVVLRGEVAGEPYERRYPVSFESTTAAGNAFVPRIWAAQRIADLELGETGGKPEAEVKAEVVALSRGYGVLSRETSLLVLESDAMFDAFGIDRSRPTVDWSGDEEAISGGAGEVLAASAGGLDGAIGASSGAGVAGGALSRRGRSAAGPGRAALDDELSANAYGPVRPTPMASAAAREPEPSPRRDAEAQNAQTGADFDERWRERRQTATRRRARRPRGPGFFIRRYRVRVGEIRTATEVSRRDLDAVDEARRALGENPDSRDRHRTLVRALSRAGMLPAAETAAREWLTRDRMDAEALTYLADVVGRQGQRERALRILSGVVDLEPDNRVLHERLAKAFERGGEAQRACDHRVSLAEIQGSFESTTTRSRRRRGVRQASSSEAAQTVARAVRCERALGRGPAASRILAARGTSERTQVESALTRGGDTERVRGDLLLDASWDVPVDLDLSIVTPQGTRISWLGGRTTVVGDQGQTPGGERLGLRRATRGTYYLEIGRSDVSDEAAGGVRREPPRRQPVSGRVRVSILGESRTIPFTLHGDRVQLGTVRVRSEWREERRNRR